MDSFDKIIRLYLLHVRLQDSTSNWLNWMIPICSSIISKVSPLSKSNSIIVLGVLEDAEAISVPFNKTRTMPVSQQLPKSSLPWPFPYNFVPIEPVTFQLFQQYQFIQLEMPAFQSPKLQSTDQPGIAVCSSNSLMVLTWSLEHPIRNFFVKRNNSFRFENVD